jgi:hypothetical protein
MLTLLTVLIDADRAEISTISRCVNFLMKQKGRARGKSPRLSLIKNRQLTATEACHVGLKAKLTDAFL